MNNDITIATTTRGNYSISDEELFEQYRHGDDDAFALLFERRKSSLYMFCLRQMCDTDRAADAFQETFLRAVKYRASYRPEKSFRSWLFTIARNVCNAAYNAERSHVGLDEILETEEPEALDSELDVTERDLLAAALARLTPHMRESLLLYEYEGFNYQEIAQMTGSSLATVKIRIHRARKLLRAMLEPWLRTSTKDTDDDL